MDSSLVSNALILFFVFFRVLLPLLKSILKIVDSTTDVPHFPHFCLTLPSAYPNPQAFPPLSSVSTSYTLSSMF